MAAGHIYYWLSPAEAVVNEAARLIPVSRMKMDAYSGLKTKV
jgi:hypothetical protein